MEIEYKTGVNPAIQDIVELYSSAGLERPLWDYDRIKKMYEHSNLVISAWHKNKLVGIARSLSDFCYCCYVSDLAVKEEYKCAGIGKRLLELTRHVIGEESNLVLLSAPSAMEFYPKIGMAKVENGFIIKRSK